ncbi:unnamed protein product [Cyprideis torosa]|uniref:Uncharacterized protein n=1 Tax=Cyprideis torosa TaxID=163714 RepID=A0A7R8WGK3_9CRUS|nr:unnamed protein product [Cyprideis torosa]CAG0892723.1 unnamed protein product [Cyprideis torosa]
MSRVQANRSSSMAVATRNLHHQPQFTNTAQTNPSSHATDHQRMESMSSGDAAHAAAILLNLGQPCCHLDGPGVEVNGLLQRLDSLRQENNKLKCDKLDLLRQHVACQREIKKLKEREMKLQMDLSSASQENSRLRALLRDYTSVDVSSV